MFNLLRVLSYPSVGKNELKNLPSESGIYYYVRFFKVLYVGQSTSLYHRWNHKGDWKHKHRDSFIGSRFARLHYRTIKRSKLDLVESLEIQRFDPVLNIQKPDPEKYKSWIYRIMEDVYWIAGIAAIGVALIAILYR